MIENVLLKKVTRFAAKSGHNTRQAMPALTEQGWVYFPNEYSDGKKVLYDLVFGSEANDDTKAKFIRLIRTEEPEIYRIAMSVRSIGQRDPIEVIQDEKGFALVDGFVRLVACIIKEILAEQAGNRPTWLLKAQVAEETEAEILEDISYQKNSCRIALNPSDLARRAYELSLYEDEIGKKRWTDAQIAEKLGLDKKASSTVCAYRKIAGFCIKNAKEQWLAEWDAGKKTMKSLLAKATGKNQEPRPPKKNLPRCMSYQACYQLFRDYEAIIRSIKDTWDVDCKVGVEIYRAALMKVMQSPKGQKLPVPPDEEVPVQVVEAA